VGSGNDLLKCRTLTYHHQEETEFRSQDLPNKKEELQEGAVMLCSVIVQCQLPVMEELF
jgi:hypothetical protein